MIGKVLVIGRTQSEAESFAAECILYADVVTIGMHDAVSFDGIVAACVTPQARDEIDPADLSFFIAPLKSRNARRIAAVGSNGAQEAPR